MIEKNFSCCSSHIHEVSLNPKEYPPVDISLRHIHYILMRALPEIFSLQPEQFNKFHLLLPIIKVIDCQELPGKMSFLVISKYRLNSFKFLFEIISQWLLVGKPINILMIYAADFRLLELGSTVYTAFEIAISVENEENLKQIQFNLSTIQSEIHLGIESAHFARLILETKGLGASSKVAIVREIILSLICRWPKAFDYRLLTEMQQVLAICTDEFKVYRSSHHLSRIIAIHYLFRQFLEESAKKAPGKRYISLKIFRAHLNLPTGIKKDVLGVLVGINSIDAKEIFEQRHFLSAIQTHIPDAQPIEYSFFGNRQIAKDVCTFYLEIEKANQKRFSDKEIKILRQELTKDLRDCIEQLIHPIFMPPNEEELMRHILNLSVQIKYLRDIPQVIINFEEQTTSHLVFYITLLRVTHPGTPSIQDLFKNSNTFLEYIHDRCKTVGNLRKKYTKEATIFRVKLLKQSRYLRKDHSIDLYKARQVIVLELLKIVGEFRDFNGGMISKQKELLGELYCLLTAENYKYNELLVENFFYSLTPVIMRTVLEPEILKILFTMFLNSLNEVIDEETPYILRTNVNNSFVFMVVKSEYREINEEINQVITQHQFLSFEYANAYIQVYEMHYVGCIYRCDDLEKQQKFVHYVETALKTWGQEVQNSG